MRSRNSASGPTPENWTSVESGNTLASLVNVEVCWVLGLGATVSSSSMAVPVDNGSVGLNRMRVVTTGRALRDEESRR
ncbi:hypothetical protein Q31a_15530 [Aureliella helgolandensis]|uniref:Uncharacterized protein n=1 Tax=Aureliella helgolandensis TaxID=2527968 RepID=A0A518G3V7_9BACT|nr:hypothetical protein Q31a_15530 [Aureliella helgolandensis]